MRRVARKTVVVVMGLAAVAAASTTPGWAATTYGWKWGRNNCGAGATPRITDVATCTACCNAAVIPLGPLTPGQAADCCKYCLCLTPPPPNPGLFGGILE